MNHLFRLLVVCVLGAFAILALSLGLARNHVDILAPAHLLLFVVGLAIYLLPSGLALYRDCRSTAWIAALDVLLGWTLFGWFASLGWAAMGKSRAMPVLVPPSGQPLPHH